MSNFELLSELGTGGMATVWKARNTASGEIVALKLLHTHLARDREYVQRFEREVEVTQRIDSPHVVSEWSLGANGSTTLEQGAGLEYPPSAWGIGDRSSISSILRESLDWTMELTGWADFPIDVTGPTELTLIDGTRHFPILKVVSASEVRPAVTPSLGAVLTLGE